MHLEDDELSPVDMEEICMHQQSDVELKDRRKNKNRSYTKKVYNLREVVLEDGKICIPKTLQPRLLMWYHHWLCHPDETRLENTIRQTMTWPGMRTQIRRLIKNCHICQMSKKTRRNYGHLPPKSAHYKPWQEVHVDCVGPYTVTQTDRKTGKKTKLSLSCMTMIDPVTCWFEIIPFEGLKPSSEVTSTIFCDNWLSRYPRPLSLTYDAGSEFKKDFKSLVEEYKLEKRLSTVKNPQSNGIIERVHGTIKNMLRSFNMEQLQLDPCNPFGEIIARVAWAVRSTYHTSLGASPGQLVFGRDMLLDMTYETDWEALRIKQQNKINKSNIRENLRRYKYDYEIGDKIVIKRDVNDDIIRAMDYVNAGPYDINKVYTNGTIRMQRGNNSERINIRRVCPYFDNSRVE